MSSNFGINVVVSSKAARNIAIDTKTSIAIAGTLSSETSFFKRFGDVDSALTELSGKTGTIIDALEDIQKQGTNCPVFLSAATKTIDAIAKLKDCKKEFGEKADLVCAPTTTKEANKNTKLQELSNALGSGVITILDLEADTETAAKTEIAALSGKRLFPVFQSGCFVLKSSKKTKRPLSAIIAGAIAKKDAGSEFAFAESPSMTLLQGIVSGGVDFEHGVDSLGDRLRTEKINCVILEDGFRLWGDNTLATDQIWQDVKRVRIFDRLEKAFLESLRRFTDQNMAGAAIYIQDAVEAFLRRLEAANVLSGFSFSWDSERNTKTNLLNGRLFLGIETQEMPTLKRLEIDLQHSDAFSESVLQIA